MPNAAVAALIERVEQATSEQQGEVIAAVLMTARKTGWLTSAQYSAALHMLVAKAYESAALALVPEGWGWHVDYLPPQTPWASLVWQGRMRHACHAATPALALGLAALRARMESAE